MPSSTDRPDSPSRQKSRAKWLARMDQYESVPARQKEHPSDLPRWVKTGLIIHAIEGLSWNETAERFGKTGSTLSEYSKSPAAKMWLESLEEFLEDPVAMAKVWIGANAMNVTLDRFVFLEAAKAAGDYKEGDRIARDIQDRAGIIAKRHDSGAIKIELSLGAGGLDTPMIEAEYTVVGEEDEDR